MFEGLETVDIDHENGIVYCITSDEDPEVVSFKL